MILFRKRTIRLVPFYLLYMAAVLAASSLYELYAAESGEIVAQVFGDRVYCRLSGQYQRLTGAQRSLLLSV